MNTCVLILMAKKPTQGLTKTRLCPPLTPRQAAALYAAMLLDSIDLGSGLEGVDLAIAVTPPAARGYFEKISPPGSRLLPVDCPDLGDCLTQVLDQALKMGYTRACAFNSDGPTLPPTYLDRAFQLLADHDLVLGPGEDGGYYLVGLREVHPELFIEIDWSTSRVLAQTLERAEQLKLKVARLPVWYDVDNADDLQRLREELPSLRTDRLVHTRRFFAGGS